MLDLKPSAMPRWFAHSQRLAMKALKANPDAAIRLQQTETCDFAPDGSETVVLQVSLSVDGKVVAAARFRVH